MKFATLYFEAQLYSFLVERALFEAAANFGSAFLPSDRLRTPSLASEIRANLMARCRVFHGIELNAEK